MAADRTRKFVVGAVVAGGKAVIKKIKIVNNMKRPFCHDYLLEHVECHHREWVRHSALWERFRRARGGFYCRECGLHEESPHRDSTTVTHSQAFWPAPPSSAPVQAYWPAPPSAKS
jgi:hypothetical protein